MLKLIERLLFWWDERRSSALLLNLYEVTPRQGRHIVRRKLFRELHLRFKHPHSPQFTAPLFKP
jgi:hypothetical protein